MPRRRPDRRRTAGRNDRMRHSRRVAIATAVALLALATMLLPTYGALDIDQQNSVEPPTGWSPLLLLPTTTQSFTPQHTNLSKVEVYLGSGLGTGILLAQDVTLSVYQFGNTTPLTSATITVPAGTIGGWFMFDVPDIALAT